MIANAQPLPAFTLETLEGNPFDSQTTGKWRLLVFYRGSHCQICAKQLRELTESQEEIQVHGVEIVAITMENRERAAEAKREWGHDITTAYGLQEDTAQALGLHISLKWRPDEPERFTEPALFLIRPDGEIHGAWIQSLPFLRPKARELAHTLEFITQRGYPIRGEQTAGIGPHPPPKAATPPTN